MTLYDIKMSHIETVIEEVEKEMMLNHTFAMLATTVSEPDTFGYDESSDSSDDDDDSSSYELEFSDQTRKIQEAKLKRKAEERAKIAAQKKQ